jgi:hypothetical protein
MPASGPARQVHLGIKKVHFMVKKRPCPLGAFYGQETHPTRAFFDLVYIASGGDFVNLERKSRVKPASKNAIGSPNIASFTG